MRTTRWLKLTAETALVFGLGTAMIAGGSAQTRPEKPAMTPEQYRAYSDTIRRTAQMVGDGDAQELVRSHGLQILNLTWEDTGRFKGSSVGPNISDMTIQVGVENPATGRTHITCMPVIRFPNFSDVTCDVDPSAITLLVGNHEGLPLRRVSLYDFLQDPATYLTRPESWPASRQTLLADRDTKVLVSAQACFLPIPKQGVATFNPVLFNYMSERGNPGVLTILATREGTSVTIIDNVRDAFSNGALWGQRLFHNANGKRASLSGQRFSDYAASGRAGEGNAGAKVRDEALNMVLLIQVPLKQKERTLQDEAKMGGFGGGGFGGGAMAGGRGGRSDVENAVIGHGRVEGPFTEMDNLPVERDPRFPVRVTVRFYKATSNGVMSEADARQIKRDIDRVYENGDSVGSLVTGGKTGRVTEYDGCKVQPPDWWDRFWDRYERNVGLSREEAVARLRRLLGKNYESRPVCELYVRDLLRSGGQTLSGDSPFPR